MNEETFQRDNNIYLRLNGKIILIFQIQIKRSEIKIMYLFII